MKMNCLSRFLPSSKNKTSNSNTNANSPKNMSYSVRRTQNIYNYCNSLVTPKKSQNSMNSLLFNNNNYTSKSTIISGSAGEQRRNFRSNLSFHSPSGMDTLPSLSPSKETSPVAADSMKLLDGYVKMRTMDICYMPDVVLDKIFSKLTDEDLRHVYQVSHLWKNAVLRRPGVNRRREELVHKIRQNKENIIKGKKELDRTDANRTTRSNRNRDTSNNTNEKPGSRHIPNDFGNQLKPCVSDNILPNVNLSHGFSSPLNSSTPVQSTDKWQHAERSLKKGQRLFRCKKCYGPVASPVASKIEECCNSGTGSSINTAKCRLTSRIASLEDLSMKPRERKKQRSLVKSSPSSFSSTHEDICSLSDIMAERLIISPEVVALERIRPKSAPPVCTNNSYNFNYSPLTPINTNFNYYNNIASPDTIDCLSSSSSQDSSDSGFMSYINSDEDSNDSLLNFSSMFTPKPQPVKKQILKEDFSPLINVNQSEGVQFGSSDSLFRKSFCKILNNRLSEIDNIPDSPDSELIEFKNNNSGFHFSKESGRNIVKSGINVNLFPKTTFGLSQPSPLGLSVSSVNLDERFVLECPDCSYRFCSSCEENEHVGRPCRVIDSDSFRQDEPPQVLSSIVSPFNNSGPKSNSNSSLGIKGKGKCSAKEESKKRLRRLAKK